MNIRFVILGVVMIGGAVVRLAAAQSGKVASGESLLPAPAEVRGPAVVELFTSEGCSSCPPAEQVLGELSEAAGRSGEPVYCLAFHVDYWNHLGWADPFSSAAFSQRQSQYAQAFHADEVYTPQMIVNGTAQFTGSDRAAARAALGGALGRAGLAKLELSVRRGADGGYTASYAVAGAPAGAVVNVAVTEQGLSSNVERGENAGRLLRDPAVVRWFSTMRVDAQGRGQITLPALAGVNLHQATVVAYVQLPDDMKILGSAAARFPTSGK
jgi:hypothetical protein